MKRYYITAVRHSEGRIALLKVHPDDRGFPDSTWEAKNRMDIVVAIQLGDVHETAYQKERGSWRRKKVHVYTLDNNTYFLRTDANNIEEDNLENLPEF